MRTHICEKQGRVDNLNFRIKLLEFENSILQLENKEVICFFFKCGVNVTYNTWSFINIY